jgi:hypothetical protein
VSRGVMAPLPGSVASTRVDEGVARGDAGALGPFVANGRGLEAMGRVVEVEGGPKARSWVAHAIPYASASVRWFSVTAWALLVAGSPSQAPWTGCVGGRPPSMGLVALVLPSFGFGTLCPAIRFPITTRALPISSLVPRIVAVRLEVEGNARVTATRAPEYWVVRRRPRPSRPTTWPAALSGIDRVQSTRSAVF